MCINHHKAFLFKCTKILTSDITCKTLNHFFITNPNICTSLTIRKKHISVHFQKIRIGQSEGKITKFIKQPKLNQICPKSQKSLQEVFILKPNHSLISLESLKTQTLIRILSNLAWYSGKENKMERLQLPELSAAGFCHEPPLELTGKWPLRWLAEIYRKTERNIRKRSKKGKLLEEEAASEEAKEANWLRE